MSHNFQKGLKIFNNRKVELNSELISELFSNVISYFDSQKILNFSINYQIPLTVSDKNGDTLIHKILDDDSCKQSELNKLNLIKFLVNQGVGPDSPNIDNVKPIHIACKKQMSLIIEYLLDIGIDINFTDNVGNSPLHYFLNGTIENYENLSPIPLIQPTEFEDTNELTNNELNLIYITMIRFMSTLYNTPLFNSLRNSIINTQDKNMYRSIISGMLDGHENHYEYDNMIKSAYINITDLMLDKFEYFKEIDDLVLHNVIFEKDSDIVKDNISIIKKPDDIIITDYYEIYKTVVKRIVQIYIIRIYEKFTNNNNLMDILIRINKVIYDNDNMYNNEMTLKLSLAKIIELIISDHFKKIIRDTATELIKSKIDPTKHDIIDDYNTNILIPLDIHPKLKYESILNLRKNKDSLEYKGNKVLLNLFTINDDTIEVTDKCSNSLDNDFIIYSNEYTGSVLTKVLHKISIDKDILKKLIYNGANVYNINNENKMPIFKILNHNNYIILNELCIKHGIKYDNIYNKNFTSPLQFIKNELKLHSQKLLYSNDLVNPNDLMKNFTYNASQEIKLLIKSDKTFGYNILKNLDLSFSMVLYLINQYMYNHIYNNNLNLGDNLYEIKNKEFRPGYITNNDLAVNELNVDIDTHIRTNTEKINILKYSRENYKKNRIIDLRAEIQQLKKIKNIITRPLDDAFKADVINTDENDIIKNYNKILNKIYENNNGPYVESWKKYISKLEFNDNDSNMSLFNIINRLNDIDYNNFNLEEFTDYEKIFKYISELCESYFTEYKYTYINETLKFINDLLIFMTQNIICNSIDIYIRKVLLKYILHKYPSRKFNFYIDTIDSIFNEPLENETTVNKYLYDTVATKLVINCSKIYKNRQEEKDYNHEPVEEILLEFIELLESNTVVEIRDDELIKSILRKDVLKYYTLITSTLIKNWQVVCEDYMRFYINQYRILACHNILMNHLEPIDDTKEVNGISPLIIEPID